MVAYTSCAHLIPRDAYIKVQEAILAEIGARHNNGAELIVGEEATSGDVEASVGIGLFDRHISEGAFDERREGAAAVAGQYRVSVGGCKMKVSTGYHII